MEKWIFIIFSKTKKSYKNQPHSNVLDLNLNFQWNIRYIIIEILLLHEQIIEKHNIIIKLLFLNVT